jgi:hypothetical protein
MILEGAIARAEEQNLAAALTRAQNNLAYILVGIDDVAGFALSGDSYRSAQRIGDRSALLFATVQMAATQIGSGNFAGAEVLLSDPVMTDPPPAARIWMALLELMMSFWRGDIETLARADEEIGTLIDDIDDPQVRAGVDNREAFVDAANDRLAAAFSRCTELLTREWNEVLEIVELSLFVGGLLGDSSNFRQIAQLLERHLPRYSHAHSLAQIVGGAGEGPVDWKEVDAIIAKRQPLGPIEVVMLSVAAAPFLESAKRAEYLSTARSLCTQNGWDGVLRLLDRHLA